MRRLVFRSGQRGRRVPLILPIGVWAKDYISMIDKLIITRVDKMSCPSFTEEIINSDDYLLKRDLFELALIEERRVRLKSDLYPSAPWDPAL